MPLAYIGIGSNLGERQKNCLEAIRLLEQGGLKKLAVSSVYETAPWGVTDQPAFINMAVKIETRLWPIDLLHLLKGFEKEMGRTEGPIWGPRLIDLDILLYDDLIFSSTEMTIPHPLLHQRDFVLIPLAEIAPDVMHPILKKTIKELREGPGRP